MKRNSTRIKELRTVLRYDQTQVRLAAWILRLAIAKCRSTAAEMRALQQGVQDAEGAGCVRSDPGVPDRRE